MEKNPSEGREESRPGDGHDSAGQQGAKNRVPPTGTLYERKPQPGIWK